MKAKTKRPVPQLPDAPRAPMPCNLKPMAPALVKVPFDHPDWLFEIKWDGYRAIAEVSKQGIRFYSRNLRPFDGRFRSVIESLQAIPHEAILDGELVAIDETGRARFEWLQNFPRLGGQLIYYVFDLLYLDGFNGENRIFVCGPTQAHAWWNALRDAQLLGMLGRAFY